VVRKEISASGNAAYLGSKESQFGKEEEEGSEKEGFW